MFRKLSDAVHARFVEMSKGELYVVEVSDLFEQYLAAFPEGSNPVVKERTEHDCQTCKSFIRRLGKVVGIVDGQVVTVWDDHDVPSPYKEVADKLGEIVRNAPIKTVFRTKERSCGVDHNYDAAGGRHDHFHGRVSDKHCHRDPETKRSEREAIFQVLKRGLAEIQRADLVTVLDLIDSNALYRGEEHRAAVKGFLELLNAHDGTDRFVWANLDNRNARFRNTVIGTLLVDLAEGKDIEQAVKAFETKVAPMNYKRPTAVITQKMVEDSVQTLTDLGLGWAIYRRFARISDVSVNDVLFVDNDTKGKMKDGVSLLLETAVKKTASGKPVPMTADEFLSTVLPKAKSLELLVENRHLGNFVSLTAPDREDAAGGDRLFKWNNGFAWSYDGDVTDSVKERVKAAGGNVNAKLRVSLSWYNFDDLDIHAVTPGGVHVHFRDKRGILDVDMNAGGGRSRTPVENLAFNDLQDGVYRVWVNQYNRRESTDVGFSIEVEFGGVVRQFSYSKAVSGDVPCFLLSVKGGVLVEVESGSGLVGGSVSSDKWGIKTQSLTPVDAVMNSPNHWGDEKVGAKHLIFALRGCKNPLPTRGIYNEFLRPDLDRHRKVFEVLGAKTKCSPTDDQVSGVGFTSARGDTVTIVVDGRRSYVLSF